MNGIKSTWVIKFSIIGVILIFAAVVLIFKNRPQPVEAGQSGELPETLLDSSLDEGRPTLAFFHSNSCEQCLKMIETVDQVYPEFHGRVDLVDVDVYDPANDPLLNKVGLMYIPTLIFYDENGESKTFVGVMDNVMLHDWLSEIAGAN